MQVSKKALVFVPWRSFAKPNMKKQAVVVSKGRATLPMHPDTRRKLKSICEYMIETQAPGPGPEVDLAARKAFLIRISDIMNKEKQKEFSAMYAKIRVKQAAISALPEALRVEALKEDAFPWPEEGPWPFAKPPSKRALNEYYGL